VTFSSFGRCGGPTLARSAGLRIHPDPRRSAGTRVTGGTRRDPERPAGTLDAASLRRGGYVQRRAADQRRGELVNQAWVCCGFDGPEPSGLCFFTVQP